MSDIFFQHRSQEIEDAQVKPRFNYGLCTSCKNLIIRKSRLRSEWSSCIAWLPDHVFSPIGPRKDDPIEECSQYYPKNQMNIQEMYKIATLIDLSIKKVVGFSGNDENNKELKITKPEDREDENEPSRGIYG